MQSFFLRENSLGPSVYTEYVEDTRAPLVKTGELPANDLDPISFKNVKLQKCLLDYFERSGEQMYHRVQFLVLVYLLQMQLNAVEPEDKELFLFAKLQRARLSFTMDKCLNQSVVHLKDESLSLYREYIEEVRGVQGSDATVQLLLAEQSYC